VHDPIGAFRRIRELYLTYLETAFRIRDPEISAERRLLLERPGTLCAELLVEPIPSYETAWPIERILEPGLGDAYLPGFDQQQRQAFVELTLSGLLDYKMVEARRVGAFPLYTHQAALLRHGVHRGRPGIATSGTGSGKTESFLLPILASIAAEATRWPTPKVDYLLRRWWQDAAGQQLATIGATKGLPTEKNPSKTPFRPHRDGEDPLRPTAIRALILYPMNALVEDQMVRLRRSLDSTDARETMDRLFHRNRIFFGRYTSQTPVTGWDFHPRLAGVTDPNVLADDIERRRRKLGDLFARMCELQSGQVASERQAFEIAKAGSDILAKEAAERGARRSARYELPFMFPSIDGSEMTSRWDMQVHPPDILISNISMLNAMLAREVDRPILSKTREWIERDEQAYFFLVLDELHLHRGSAGTEVAYLLRLLLSELGLDRPEHRHKLRILASSASLPVDDPEKRKDSLEFLWGMFGANGTFSRPRENDGDRSPETWASAIEPGKPLPDMPTGSQALQPETFARFLRLQLPTNGVGPDENESAELLEPNEPRFAELWVAVATALGKSNSNSLSDTVRFAIEEASRRLGAACSGPLDDSDPRPRATSLSHIAVRLFSLSSPERLTDHHVDAVRGLLLIRGAGDVFSDWFATNETRPVAKTFRLHAIYRSIEGLFAPLLDTNRVFGDLTIERGSRAEGSGRDDQPPRPLLEVLYCEACGELFVGGRTDSSLSAPGGIDLLPTEPRLEGLPDQAVSQRFEDLTYFVYRIFWPTGSSGLSPLANLDSREGNWLRGEIDPDAARVRIFANPTDTPTAHAISGFFWRRRNGVDDPRHRRSERDAGTHLPYACPRCGTSYRPRQQGQRLSPIRSFRTGFGKTTQLLSTETFEVLRTHSKLPKLVSFADSRQEAAHAALDIERHHHQDVRRALLVHLLRERKDQLVDPGRRAELEADKQRAVAAEDFRKAERIKIILKSIEGAVRDSVVPIADILESEQECQKTVADGRSHLRQLISRFVQLGIHPTDETGVERIRAKVPGQQTPISREWDELFAVNSDPIDWQDANQTTDQAQFDALRREVVSSMLRDLSEVLFSKTYFALEESGLGYPAVPRGNLHEEEWQQANAFLRVFADAYRFAPDSDLYYDQDEPRALWRSAQEVSKGSRVRQYAKVLWGESEHEPQLQIMLDILADAGHRDGLISNHRLLVRLAAFDDLYFRCERCSRVHLHRGAGKCTRCFEALPATGRPVGELRRENYLAKRVERNSVFRLRCEELTGQTEDPTDRQRRFREVIPAGKYRPKEIIDLLSVTTTMEVGIDIGPLQAIMLANMPPQRFNYQQRVGRAGRRGQAYCIAVTVCRTKSHDLYYFRNPERITGDEPPPPFLAKQLALIAKRLVRKAWLCRAFEVLRIRARTEPTRYPGDWATPDIHGEFVPADQWLAWRDRVRSALAETTEWRDRVAAEFARWGGPVMSELVCSADELVVDVDDIPTECKREGLAHSLAEAGRLPMYGMPTRIRNLYFQLRHHRDEPRRWRYSEALTIDRDTELAIYEFAPGSVVTKDKKEHLCVGFTPVLKNTIEPTGPWYQALHNKQNLPPVDGVMGLEAFGQPFWIGRCRCCGSWRREDTEPTPDALLECRICRAVLDQAGFKRCREPLAYRTDFLAKPAQDSEQSGARFRAVQADGMDVALAAQPGSNLAYHHAAVLRTFRINRGRAVQPDPDNLASYAGFTTEVGEEIQRTGSVGRIRLRTQHIDIAQQSALQRILSKSPGENAMWLAAPKTTEGLYIAPAAVPAGLRLASVSGPTAVTSVRAAALSATFLFIDKASFELDIDPDEFDVIEPVWYRPQGRDAVPLLQIVDHLVNGAGFCRRLSELRGTEPILAVFVRETVDIQRRSFPLDQFLENEHVRTCDQACYKCLLRYRNQPYHGLLDWQLGLTFLQSLITPSFQCGLDGDFANFAGLSRWPAWAEYYARQMARLYAGEATRANELWCFTVPARLNRPVIIVHPLWDRDSPGAILREALEEATDHFGLAPHMADTFNLARRPGWVIERLGRGEPA
jgi:Lhr-like helicase